MIACFGADVVVTTGVVRVGLLDPDPAPAIPAMSNNATPSGTAIFAQNGHDRNQATGVVPARGFEIGTVAMMAVGSPEVIGTA